MNFKTKVNSVQEAFAKFFEVYTLEFEILQTIWSKNYQKAKSIDKKLNTKGLMFFVSYFSCDLQDFRIWYVNRKAFDASFLYWVDFTTHLILYLLETNVEK